MSGFTADGGEILATVDGGATWHSQYRDSRPVDDLQFISPLVGWAVMTPLRGQWDEVPSVLLHTSDRGDHWQAVASLKNLSDFDFITADLGRAVVEGRLMETADGGRTWTVMETPLHVRSVCFADPDHGWAVSERGVLFSADGGRRWEISLATPTTDGDHELSPYSLNCKGQDTAWAVFIGGAAASHLNYVLYRTTDRGGSWMPVMESGFPELGVTGRGPAPGDLSILDGDTAFFETFCGPCAKGMSSIQRTTDSGHTWSQPVIIPALEAPLIEFVDIDRGWAVGLADFRHPVILATTDGGKTWKQQHP